MRVLIVEDEACPAEAIRDGLGPEAIAADLAVLDHGAPGALPARKPPDASPPAEVRVDTGPDGAIGGGERG